jgi:hypothetical protein
LAINPAWGFAFVRVSFFLKGAVTMANRNRTVLAVEHLEARDTPAEIGSLGGALGGGHAEVILYIPIKGNVDVLVTPGGNEVTLPSASLHGLLQAVEGSGHEIKKP